MQVLFYIIIIAVLIVKILFWTIYVCIRRRRLQRQREVNRAVETCYEEVPAVPQPAYVFSGLSPEDLRHTALMESLPGYQHDDPYKTDRPPPSYEQNFHTDRDSVGQGSSSLQTLEELVTSIESTDTAGLIDNQEDDDYICLQQMA